jgi:hypothetical protein
MGRFSVAQRSLLLEPRLQLRLQGIEDGAIRAGSSGNEPK